MNNSPANSNERFKYSQEFLEFSSFADSLNDGLYATDPDGRFIYVNKALVKILGGEKPGELLGQSFLDFIEPSNKEVMKQRYQTFQHSNVPSSLITVRIIRAGYHGNSEDRDPVT